MCTLVGKTDGTQVITRVLVLPIGKEKLYYFLERCRAGRKETGRHEEMKEEIKEYSTKFICTCSKELLVKINVFRTLVIL